MDFANFDTTGYALGLTDGRTYMNKGMETTNTHITIEIDGVVYVSHFAWNSVVGIKNNVPYIAFNSRDIAQHQVLVMTAYPVIDLTGWTELSQFNAEVL